MKKINLAIFNSDKKPAMVDNLLDVVHNDALLSDLTILQNEISVDFDTKVIAVTSINKDTLAASFAKGLGDAFVANGSSALVIDANLYNPILNDLLADKRAYKGAKVISLNKNIYPALEYKNGVVHNVIKENNNSYEHFIVIVPSIKDHKEVSLLGDILNSLIIVTQKNVTKRKDVFNAHAYCYETKLPLAKTVILK